MQEDNAIHSSSPAGNTPTPGASSSTIATNWTEQAIDEATDILTKPPAVTGWDGIGYSVMVGGEERSHDFYCMRGCDDKWMEDFLQCIRSYHRTASIPLIRYYASYGGADVLKNEVWRLHEENVIVVAKIGFRGIERAGKFLPPPSVELLQSCPLTMLMIRDICHQMSGVGNRFWLRSLMGDWKKPQ
jgi:hypothetical protein